MRRVSSRLVCLARASAAGHDRGVLPVTPVSLWCLRLSLSGGRYFDAISVGEALAHEFAVATLNHGPVTDLEQLPLRAAIGDPCDLPLRPASAAITTLTLRRPAAARVRRRAPAPLPAPAPRRHRRPPRL